MLQPNLISLRLPNSLWIAIIILLEGFVTIAVEVLTLRQLSPFFGTSVVTSSCIIGFFLFFLACGYYKGGLIHSDWCEKLSQNFLKITFLFGIGLSYPFISGFYYFSSHYLTSTLLLQLIVYLFCVTGPITYLLGQTLPITTHFFLHKNTSLINSHVLGLSTLGSFLGALITSLLFMPYLGVANTLLCLYSFLGFLILLITPHARLVEQFTYFMIAGIILFILNVKAEQTLFIKTNAYANYQVITNPSQPNNKIFSINGNSSSSINQKNKNFPYIEKIKQILFTDLRLRNKNILVLGAGGFTLSAKNTYQNQFDYVDIDPNIKNIVETSFLPHINGNFIAQDAYTFIQQKSNQYDVIINDVFKARTNIPEHLVTQQYFLNVKKALKTGGLAVFNVIAKPTLSDSYSATINNTLQSVFNSCMIIPVGSYNNSTTNILYICKKNNHKKFNIYTQDKNPVALDYFKSLT